MKIILFHHSFNKVAGTERVLYNIIEYLNSKKNIQIILLLADKESKPAFDFSSFKIELVFLNVEISGSSYLQLVNYHWRLFKKVSHFINGNLKDNNSILLATTPILAAIAYAANRLNMNRNLRIISCEHFALEVSGLISKLIRKALYKYMTVVVLTKRDLLLINTHYKPLGSYCIPNAIPFEPKKYHFDPEKKMILAIGRLTRQKGFDMLIRSFSKIAHHNENWQLNIIGEDYGDKAMLQSLIDELSLDNVSIFPPTNNVSEWYQKAAFFVLSSRFEGLPMVMLEAIGFGLPIVAFDCPTGPAELIDESNGILVEKNDISGLALAMEEMINNPKLIQLKAKGTESRAYSYHKNEINKLWDNLFEEINI